MIVKRNTEIHRYEETGNQSPKLGKRLRQSLYVLGLSCMLLLPSQSFAATDLLQGVSASTTATTGFSNPYGSTDKNDITSTDIPAYRTVYQFNIPNIIDYNLPSSVNISSLRIKVNYSVLLNSNSAIQFISNGNVVGTVTPNSNDYVLTGLNYTNVQSIRVTTNGYSSTPLKIYSFEAY